MADETSIQPQFDDSCGMGVLKDGPRLVLSVIRADGTRMTECTQVYDSWDETLTMGDAALVAMGNACDGVPTLREIDEMIEKFNAS